MTRLTRLEPVRPEPSSLGRWNGPSHSAMAESCGRVVSGQRRLGDGAESMISSGPNRGRDLIGGVAPAFGAEPSEVEAEIAANVDLASSLLEAARRGEEQAFPTAMVLPVGACAPEFRWFDAVGWRPIAPETRPLLSVPAAAAFRKYRVTCRAIRSLPSRRWKSKLECVRRETRGRPRRKDRDTRRKGYA